MLQRGCGLTQNLSQKKQYQELCVETYGGRVIFAESITSSPVHDFGEIMLSDGSKTFFGGVDIFFWGDLCSPRARKGQK